MNVYHGSFQNRDINFFEDVLNVIERISPSVGSPGKFWLGPTLCINITTPESSEKVLNDPGCLDKGELYDFVSDGMGAGLVTLRGNSFLFRKRVRFFFLIIRKISPGATWKTHRKNINPCFSSSIINSYFPIMNQACRELVDNVQRRIDNGSFVLREALGKLALDMICGNFNCDCV